MHRLLIKIIAGRDNVGLKNLADPEIPDLQCAACMGCRLLSAGANYAEQNLDTDNSGPDTANVPGADTCLGGADLAPQNLGCILAAAAHIPRIKSSNSGILSGMRNQYPPPCHLKHSLKTLRNLYLGENCTLGCFK